MQVEMTKEEAVLVLNAIARMELSMLDPKDKMRRELFVRMRTEIKRSTEPSIQKCADAREDDLVC